MDISIHAISRLEERFGYDKTHLKSIVSILSNKRSYKVITQKKDGSHYKFKYYGQHMVAVIRNNTIVTFKYTEKTYQDNQKGLAVGQRYTVKELCNQLEVPKRTMIDTINRIDPSLMKHGVTTWIDEDLATEISKELKKAHNIDCASTRTVATTEKEAIEAIYKGYTILLSKYSETQNKIAELAPKAELAEIALRDETKQYSIRDSGKHLGLSQTEIFTLMREKGLLTLKNLPTQKALNYNVLSLKTNVVNGKNREQSVMTMDNINEFNKRYLYKGGK